MKTEIIDVHCHLLPGIDDGAKNISETIAALRMAENQGVKKIILTPHLYPDKRIAPEQVLTLLQQMTDVAAQENIRVQLLPGMECMYFSGLPSLLERGEVLTLAGSHYVLVEFPPEAPFVQIEGGIDDILEVGLIPVLAHYERYLALVEKKRIGRLRAAGCLLQMNYDTIRRKYGIFRRNPFHKDLKNGWVDLLGSDCHGCDFRPYHLEPSVAWLEQNVSPENVADMVYKNPMRIINDSLFMNGEN